MPQKYGEDTQFWTTHVRRSGPGAGEQRWRALTVVAMPVQNGVWLSLRTRSGRGGNAVDRVVFSGRLDLGDDVGNADIGPLLLAVSDALAASADNLP
jgi:hypothetical protein